MSLQTWWSHCGEGFIGIDKLKRVVADVSDDTSIKSQKNKKKEVKIVTGITPEGKGKDTSRTDRSMHVPGIPQSSIGPSHVTMNGFSNSIWKQGDFLEEFSIRQKAAFQTNDDIKWSTSSSDECLPNESHPKIRKRASKSAGLRKKIQHSSNICTNTSLHRETLSSKSVSPVVAEHISLKLQSPNNPSVPENSYLDPRGIAEVTDDMVGCRHTTSPENLLKMVPSDVFQKIVKRQNGQSWTISAFDDAMQTTTAVADVVVAGHSKLKRRCNSFLPGNGRHLKSRFVRKFCKKESQESFGQISDVESDTELEDFDISQDVIDSADEAVPKVSQSIGDQKLNHRLCQNVTLHTSVQEDDMKINISSGTSSPCSSAQSEKIRASDWVKAVQKQKTPAKGGQLESSLEDSTKKKRRFTRGSMADQLTRLMSREKASVRIWYHSLSTGTLNESTNKCLLIKLLSLEKQFSVVMSQAHVVEESGGAVLCRVVFTCDIVNKLSLKPGMTVQVFAPWQQLDEIDGTRTILCSQFVRVSSSVSEQYEVNKKVTSRSSASALWLCPCSKDSHLPSHACPAALYPVLPYNTAQAVYHAGSSVLPSATLHTIVASPQHPIVTASRKTLLESLEGAWSDSSVLSPFSALVLRVFRRRVNGTLKQRLQLLVEDSAGTLAIVRLSDDLEVGQRIMCKAEGRICRFSHLYVTSRTNRDKDRALFGIIEQVWTQQFLSASSQQSGSDTSQVQLRAAAPGYAYILHAVLGTSCMCAVEEDDTTKETSMNLVTLSQVVQTDVERRVSFVARVMFPARFNQVTGSAVVFVYDSSADTEHTTAVHRVKIDSECVMEDTSTDMHLFRDVILQKGEMRCDSYTLLLEMPAWTTWDMHNKINSSIVASVMSCPVKLLPVCCASSPGSLVSIEGFISGIDENLSYSWEECETCRGDKLATSEESGVIYCTGCNRQVVSPVARTRMEVFVACKSSSTTFVVKLDLTQKSIESLLPPETSDEGYDTDQVVGKTIKYPACLVQNKPSSLSQAACEDQKYDLMLMELQC